MTAPKAPKPTIESLQEQLRHERSIKELMIAREADKDNTIRGFASDVKELMLEVNTLRDKLLTATLDCERMRGYMDCLSDQEPPRMVPEDKRSRSDEIVAKVMANQNHIGWAAGGIQKPWYHR